MTKLTVQVPVKVDIDFDRKDLGRLVMSQALDLFGVDDDPGVDYFTNDERHVFMGSQDCDLGYSLKFATLVDAANLLIYGKFMTMPDLVIPERPGEWE